MVGMENLLVVYGTNIIYVYDDYKLARARVFQEHKYVKASEVDKYIKIIPRDGNHFNIRKVYNGEML